MAVLSREFGFGDAPLPRWLNVFGRSLLALYASMRRWALPRREVEEHSALRGLHRRARRELSQTGQVGSQLPDIHRAAVESALIAGQELLVWLDN